MIKIAIVVGATLAVVTAGGTAAIPRPTARLSASSRGQDADWPDPGRQEPTPSRARALRVALWRFRAKWIPVRIAIKLAQIA